MTCLTKLGLLFLFSDRHDFEGHRILASEPSPARGGIFAIPPSSRYLRAVCLRMGMSAGRTCRHAGVLLRAGFRYLQAL